LSDAAIKEYINNNPLFNSPFNVLTICLRF
jgi:hypothetical protein